MRFKTQLPRLVAANRSSSHDPRPSAAHGKISNRVQRSYVMPDTYTCFQEKLIITRPTAATLRTSREIHHVMHWRHWSYPTRIFYLKSEINGGKSIDEISTSRENFSLSLSVILLHWEKKNGCNYRNLTIIYDHFFGTTIYLFNHCFNHANILTSAVNEIDKFLINF